MFKTKYDLPEATRVGQVILGLDGVVVLPPVFLGNEVPHLIEADSPRLV
jgi:hypothetical protein